MQHIWDFPFITHTVNPSLISPASLSTVIGGVDPWCSWHPGFSLPLSPDFDLESKLIDLGEN